MSEVSYDLPKNLVLHKKYDYQLDVSEQTQYENVVIVGIHAHNKMDEFLQKINCPSVLLLAIPCCVQLNIPEATCIAYPEIFSGKNKLYVYHRGIPHHESQVRRTSLKYKFGLAELLSSGRYSVEIPLYELDMFQSKRHTNCYFTHYFNSQSFCSMMRGMTNHNIPNSILADLTVGEIVQLATLVHMLLPNRAKNKKLQDRSIFLLLLQTQFLIVCVSSLVTFQYGS